MSAAPAEFCFIAGRALDRAMALMTAIATPQPDAPIRACVKLGCDGARLTIEAADADMHALTTLDLLDGAAPAGPWSLLLGAPVLAAIARVAGLAGLRLERHVGPAGEIAARILIGDIAYELRGLAEPAGFPLLAGGAGLPLGDLPGYRLSPSQRQPPWCLGAAYRPALPGIAAKLPYFPPGNPCATLARYRAANDAPAPAYSLPARAAALLGDFAAGQPVSGFAAGAQHLDFCFGRTRLRIRTIAPDDMTTAAGAQPLRR